MFLSSSTVLLLMIIERIMNSSDDGCTRNSTGCAAVIQASSPSSPVVLTVVCPFPAPSNWFVIRSSIEQEAHWCTAHPFRRGPITDWLNRNSFQLVKGPTAPIRVVSSTSASIYSRYCWLTFEWGYNSCCICPIIRSVRGIMTYDIIVGEGRLMSYSILSVSGALPASKFILTETSPSITECKGHP